MHRFILLLALTIGFASSAQATQWVICGNCTTPAQFEYAAQQHHGERPGWMVWAVANPNTPEFVWVETNYTPPGQVIQDDGDPIDMSIGPSKSRVSGNQLTPVRIPDVFLAPSDMEIQRIRSLDGGGSRATSAPPSSAERIQFEALVSLTRDRVFFKPDDSTPFYASFQSSYHDYRAALDSTIRHALGASNPGWNGTMLGPLGGLMTALKSYFGHGPIGCVTFDNGDVGCFQLNMLFPGALLYVEGTGRRVDGTEIVETGIGIGGGGDIEVHPDTPGPGQVTYIIGNGYSMVCGYVMGQLDGCQLYQVVQ